LTLQRPVIQDRFTGVKLFSKVSGKNSKSEDICCFASLILIFHDRLVILGSCCHKKLTCIDK
jgi:hypothetical protein